MSWTADDLVASVSRRAMLPATQDTIVVPDDVLAFADEETGSIIVPLISSMKQWFYTTKQSTLIATDQNGVQNIRIPSRAVGSTVSDVSVYDPNFATFTKLTRKDIGRLGDTYTPTFWPPDFRGSAYYFDGPNVVLWKCNSFNGKQLLLTYQRRCSKLVMLASVAQVATIGTGNVTITQGTNPIFPAGSNQTSIIDIVSALPSFESKGDDITALWNKTALTLTFTQPTGLAVGDYICLAGQTPVPQMPPEAFNFLAERVASCCYKSLNDDSGFQKSQGKCEELKEMVISMLGDRDTGDAEVVTLGNSAWVR